jgi:hypothetical protein
LILIIIFAKINKNNMVPSGTRFVGYAEGVNLEEKKSKVVNSQSAVYTLDEIRGYKVYTALLTQSGGDDIYSINSGSLTVGVTYSIAVSSVEPPYTYDFTNVGAPNNDNGTYFVATGTTPNSWGNGMLQYNTGAPVVTVLENTIGNIWFNYETNGGYGCQSNNLFTTGKTFILVTPTSDSNAVSITVTNQTESVKYISPLNNSLNSFDNGLLNTPIEIRVYN